MKSASLWYHGQSSTSTPYKLKNDRDCALRIPRARVPQQSAVAKYLAKMEERMKKQKYQVILCGAVLCRRTCNFMKGTLGLEQFVDL